MATKKTPEVLDLPIPLEPVETWADAADLARSALVFTLSDSRESGAVRVKAAELILEYSRPKPRDAPTSEASGEGIEDWLSRQQTESRL